MRAIDGGRNQRFGRCHSQFPACQRYDGLHVEHGTIGTIEIAAQRHRGASLEQSPRRGRAAACVKGQTGQQCDDRTRCRQPSQFRDRDLLQMVDAGDPQIARQRRRFARPTAIGVHPAAQAKPGSRLQVAPDQPLPALDGAPNDIGKLGQPPAIEQRQELRTRPLHGCLRRIRPFRGRWQTQEESGYHLDRVLTSQGQRTQQFQLGAWPSPAPGLDLYRGGAMTRHRPQIFPHLVGDASSARCLDRVQRRRRISVRPARRRKSQMGVAVHESRHHHPPGRADLHRVTRRLQVLHPARQTYFLDQPIADQHRSVEYQSRVVQERPAAGLRWAAHGKKLARAPNQYGPRLFSPPDFTVAADGKQESEDRSQKTEDRNGAIA